MLEPPDRNSSTLIPFFCSNRLAIFCAVSIGTDVYHTTLPSRLAAAMSTASAAIAGPKPPARTSIAQDRKKHGKRQLSFFILIPLGSSQRILQQCIAPAPLQQRRK